MSRIHPVTLPKWGLEMSEGTLAAWRVAVGTTVAKGAELVDIETDKIVNTLELDRAGVLRRCIGQEGDKLPVGALIAVVAEPGVTDAEIDGFIAAFKPIDASFEPRDAVADTPVAPAMLPRAVASAAQAAVAPDELQRRNAAAHASPIARRLADQLGIDLSAIKGTGKGDRISQQDVEARATALGVTLPARDGAAPPSPAEPPSTLVRWTAMRQVIVETVVASKQTVPHFYTTMDVVLDAALTLRERLNAATPGPRVSLNDMIIKAVAIALGKVPAVNVHVEPRGIRQFTSIDIALPVAIAGGILAPVLRNVASKSLTALATESAQVFQRARARTLTAEDLKGATMTVSNLGMFGVRAFDAIITPPQAAVLAVGATRREMREGANGAPAFVSVLSLTLSADHRAIDGALAARFLSALKDALESPAALE